MQTDKTPTERLTLGATICVVWASMQAGVAACHLTGALDQALCGFTKAAIKKWEGLDAITSEGSYEKEA